MHNIVRAVNSTYRAAANTPNRTFPKKSCQFLLWKFSESNAPKKRWYGRNSVKMENSWLWSIASNYVLALSCYRICRSSDRRFHLLYCAVPPLDFVVHSSNWHDGIFVQTNSIFIVCDLIRFKRFVLGNFPLDSHETRSVGYPFQIIVSFNAYKRRAQLKCITARQRKTCVGF